LPVDDTEIIVERRDAVDKQMTIPQSVAPDRGCVVSFL
jgi:hypothetical protein